MGDVDDIRIETLEDHEDADVRAMLVDLALAEQGHFDHPPETAEQLTERLRPAPHFRGDNHLLVARTHDGGAIGLCWVVLFDPGTGLEAEVAELYVRPEGRGRGVAHRLMAAAMELIRERDVTFACVWTRGDNPAALAAYEAAGFAPTEQTVLTWLPLGWTRGRDNSRSMTLSRDDVDHVAMLARLGLSDEEKSRLLGELEKILDHIARLQQVDTSMLAETAQVGDLVNVMRADVPEPTLGTAAALRNAPATDGNYFVVGAIQGNELDS